jgi:signal transduction histidine kinase
MNVPDFNRVKSNWKEIARQYRVPLALAILWGGVRYLYPGESIKLISDFATAFFLASWMYGQYNRVDRQSDTTQRLEAIQQALSESSKADARATKYQQELAASLARLSEVAESPSPQLRQAIIDSIRAAQLANSERQSANTALIAAVSNLASNAVYANPPGSKFTITVESEATQPPDQNGKGGSPTPDRGGTIR